MSMYPSVTLFAVALQLCIFSVLGDEVSFLTPGLKTLVTDFENICGEPEVWRRLTKDSSIDGVSNIPWAKIDKLMEEHLKDKHDRIVILEQEIQSLDGRIADKLRAEEAVDMPVEDMTKLIEDGVAPFAREGEKGIVVAHTTKCGKPFARPRAPEGANQASPGKFTEEAEKYFQGKLKAGKPARCTADIFLEECLRLLPKGETAHDSYCPALCQKFTTIATRFSEETAGETAGKTSTELAGERLKKADALAACKADVSSCKTAQEFITGLGQQITAQKQQIEMRFGEYQAAETALADAEYTLDDVIMHLEKESLALAKAEEALKQSTEDTSVAEADVAALKNEEEELRAKLEELKLAMKQAEEKLAECKQADTVVTKIKNAVATVAANMRMLFTRVALEPLDKMGLGTETDMSDYVGPADPSGEDEVDGHFLRLATAGKLKKTLVGLKHFCEEEGPAKTAFKRAEDLIDQDELTGKLGEMCAFGEPQAVYEELATAVTKTKKGIKKKIDDLQTWFDELKGQSEMTPKRVAEFEKLGEPKGLRATVGVYSRTDFFRNYLKEWLLKGDFLGLIAQLKDVVGEADTSFKALSAKEAPLEQDIAEAMSKKEKAMQALDAALKTVSSNEAAKSELQGVVSALTADRSQAQDDYNRLLAEFRKAEQRWDESKVELVKAHQEATSLLQSLTDEESSLLDMVVEQSKRELARMRVALREAEKEFAAAGKL